jgi:hypothetical protein
LATGKKILAEASRSAGCRTWLTSIEEKDVIPDERTGQGFSPSPADLPREGPLPSGQMICSRRPCGTHPVIAIGRASGEPLPPLPGAGSASCRSCSLYPIDVATACGMPDGLMEYRSGSSRIIADPGSGAGFCFATSFMTPTSGMSATRLANRRVPPLWRTHVDTSVCRRAASRSLHRQSSFLAASRVVESPFRCLTLEKGSQIAWCRVDYVPVFSQRRRDPSCQPRPLPR